MKPAVSVVKRTPRFTEPVSGSLAKAGSVDAGQIEHGHVVVTVPTLTPVPGPGTSIRPLSSVARVLMTTEPAAVGVQV